MLAMIKTESAAINTQIDFNDSLIEKWIDFVDAPSPQTVKAYTVAIKRFYRYLQKINCSQPTRATLKDYCDEMSATLKPASVRLNLNSVKLFFAFLSSEGLYKNVGLNVKFKGVKQADHTRAALTAEEAVKVLKTMPQDNSEVSLRNRCIMMLMFCCGLRRSDVSILNKSSIKSRGGKYFLDFVGKGQKAAKVVLPVKLYEMLKSYISLKGNSGKANAPLFTATSRRCKGKRLEVDSISRIAKAALVNAGFEGEEFVCHSCRHSFCSICLDIAESEKTITLKNIQIAMRHESLRTTERYMHLRDELNNPSTALVCDKLLRGLLNSAA